MLETLTFIRQPANAAVHKLEGSNTEIKKYFKVKHVCKALLELHQNVICYVSMYKEEVIEERGNFLNPRKYLQLVIVGFNVAGWKI